MSVAHGSNSVRLESLSPSTSTSPQDDVVRRDGLTSDAPFQGEGTWLASRAESEFGCIEEARMNGDNDNPGKEVLSNLSGHSLTLPLHACHYLI